VSRLFLKKKKPRHQPDHFGLPMALQRHVNYRVAHPASRGSSAAGTEAAAATQPELVFTLLALELALVAHPL
jgi:hypothetical protein